MPFAPRFTLTHSITAALTAIERARGFREAATLSEGWIERMSARALLFEAHHGAAACNATSRPLKPKGLTGHGGEPDQHVYKPTDKV